MRRLSSVPAGMSFSKNSEELQARVSYAPQKSRAGKRSLRNLCPGMLGKYKKSKTGDVKENENNDR